MAAAGGQADYPLKYGLVEDALRSRPYEFRFFQAVRLIEAMRADRAEVGRFARPEEEAVRFRANTGLAFPASEIQELDWPADGPPEMAVNFMGLIGPSGVLPTAYSELVIERIRAKDRTLESFLNIFHHRAVSLFYQAWQKNRAQLDREDLRERRVSRYIRALIGLATSGLEDRQEIADESLLYYAGLFALQPRSASALQEILSGYFEVPVEVEQFVGTWCEIGQSDQLSVGEDGDEGFEGLGQGVVVGDAVWDRRSRARVRMGPMPREIYASLLPDGGNYAALRALIRFFSNGAIDCEIQLVLDREDVPSCQLGDESGDPCPLGWLTWMKSVPDFARDPDDTVLTFS